MAACEQCWSDAVWRAHLMGGHVVDHYRDLLAEYPRGHDPERGPDDDPSPTEEDQTDG